MPKVFKDATCQGPSLNTSVAGGGGTGVESNNRTHGAQSAWPNHSFIDGLVDRSSESVDI